MSNHQLVWGLAWWSITIILFLIIFKWCYPTCPRCQWRPRRTNGDQPIELPSRNKSDRCDRADCIDSSADPQGNNNKEEQQQEESVTNRILFELTLPTSDVSTVPTPVSTTTKRIKSIAHDNLLVGLRSVLFHVDLEHGGNYCGVPQLAVVACNITEAKVIGEFNEHIKPPASVTWSDHASEVHRICSNDERITSAAWITEVWKRFVLFIEGHLAEGTKKGIIAAWGGQSCDCEWLFRVTEDSHHGTSGRILHTDNFCTSLSVMKHIFTSFRMHW
jgi:hypothetical protein